MSSGPPTSARTNPATRRRRVSAPPERGRRAPPPAAAWLTMWTSMLPASRVTVAPMPGPLRADASRPRRETPMTSCVALTPLANSTSAVGTSSPTTWWYVPPSCSTSAR
ncbi:Uncharacterised protein [Mycobacteroides abscessus]|nr:Uncharacterised protein [Mycobacteroides abscessus]